MMRPNCGSPVDHAVLAALLGDPVPTTAPTSAGDEYARGAQEAVRFLRPFTASWRGDCWLNICAKRPGEGPGGMEGRSWRVVDLPGAWPEIATYIADRNRSGRQLYFCADPLARRVDSKPRSDDVAAVTALHADIDPDVAAAGSFEAARAVLWGEVDEIRLGSVPITWVVDSGHGAGLFAILETPLDPAAGVAARLAWQGRLRARVAGVVVDHTQDAGRIMRLPGPRNWPEARKVAKGYPRQGSWASLRDHRAGAAVPVAVADELAAATPQRPQTGAQAVSQDDLLAPSLDLLAEAVEHLPPPTGDYREWIAMGHAIKAAGGEAELWQVWSDKWEGSNRDAEGLLAKWDTFRPPFAAGWQQIERAARLGTGWIGAVAHDFAGVVEQLRGDMRAATALQRNRLRVLSMEDCESAPARRYIIKGVLARSDLGILYGLPGAGKSALGPLMAHAVAKGALFFGKRTRQGPILYIAAEDGLGLIARTAALRRVHGAAPGFFLTPDSVDLRQPDQLAAIKSIIEERGVVLVVVDTLAAAFPGFRENEPDDMGQAVAVLRSLSAPTSAAVLVVHHGVKEDNRGPRGHSVLNGSADVTLHVKVSAEAGGPRVIEFHKNRNGPSDLRLGFTVRGEIVGIDEDGDAITAALAVPWDAPMQMHPKLSEREGEVLDKLARMVGENGETLPMDAGFPSTAMRGLKETAWREECCRAGLLGKGKVESQRTSFNRVVRALRRKGRIGERDGWVWPTPTTGSGKDFLAEGRG